MSSDTCTRCQRFLLNMYVMLIINCRKKVLTDPRLSKSKSPSSSGNRWYTGGDDDSETSPVAWFGGSSGVGHVHHAAANELSPPLLGLDDTSVSILEWVFFVLHHSHSVIYLHRNVDSLESEKFNMTVFSSLMLIQTWVALILLSLDPWLSLLAVGG